ncbi:MAG: alpha/beta hydrolase [Parvularculales bacterium]
MTSAARIEQNLPGQGIFTNPKTGVKTSYRLKKNNTAGQTPGQTPGGLMPMVFLHGFNGNSRSWACQFDFFSNRTLLALDAPGYGQSDAIDGGMPQIADEAAALIRATIMPPAVIVGHSMGGMLAQVLAASHNGLACALVLSCTHTGYAKAPDTPLGDALLQRLEERRTMDDETYGSRRVRAMLPGVAENETFDFLADIAGEVRAGGIRCGGWAMHHLDTRPLLHRIKMPVCLITAANDTVVTPETGAALTGGLPGAEQFVIPEVGHAPYCEDPARFNAIISNFLAPLNEAECAS